MIPFDTPSGAAGADIVNALEESVNAQLEQMFDQAAKRNYLVYRVGRAGITNHSPDFNLRMDAQKRECDASIVFHAGRALELALQVLYARMVDRVLGRKSPGVKQNQIKKDRQSHNFKPLYDLIEKDSQNENVMHALEDAYQRALHAGIIDFVYNDEPCFYFLTVENRPFREVKVEKWVDGAEFTIDHDEQTVSGIWVGNEFVEFNSPKSKSDFSGMSETTFKKFLSKADKVYNDEFPTDEQMDEHPDTPPDATQSRRSMRWAHYSARDHQYFRTYTTIGTLFFARLIGQIICLSHQKWIWHKNFARRFYERQQYLERKRIEMYADQNFDEELKLPKVVPIDAVMKRFEIQFPDGVQQQTKNYNFLHKTVRVSVSKRTP